MERSFSLLLSFYFLSEDMSNFLFVHVFLSLFSEAASRPADLLLTFLTLAQVANFLYLLVHPWNGVAVVGSLDASTTPVHLD